MDSLATGKYDDTDLHGKHKINNAKDPDDDDKNKKGKARPKKSHTHA